MKPTINTNKTNTALCGLISGLLLLAAGTAQTHAGLIYVASGNNVEKIDSVTGADIGLFGTTPGGVDVACPRLLIHSL